MAVDPEWETGPASIAGTGGAKRRTRVAAANADGRDSGGSVGGSVEAGGSGDRGKLLRPGRTFVVSDASSVTTACGVWDRSVSAEFVRTADGARLSGADR